MNGLKTAFLLTLMTLLVIGVGDYFGGRTGMVYAFIFAGAMNFISYFFSDKIALAMYRAQPVTREQLPRSTSFPPSRPTRLQRGAIPIMLPSL